jgi:D-amino-acid dehydrogenase
VPFIFIVRKKMGSNRDVIIIGGGVIGLACAHYLIDSGVGVRVLDSGKVGEGSSHGNCGLLYFSDVMPLCSPGVVAKELIKTLKGVSPLYIKPELDIAKYLWLLKFAMKCNSSHRNQAAKDKYEFLMYSMELFKSLFASFSLPCDFEDIGVLTVFKEEENFKASTGTQEFLASFGLQGEKITKERLVEMEPALLDDLAGAWLNKADWHLRPELLMKAWHNLLLDKGVIFHENCEVLDLSIKNSSIDQVHTSQESFQATDVILAAGAWTPKLTRKLGLNLPVLPGKGYSITMGRPEICPTHSCVLYEKNMVMTPWRSAYRLGGTMEFSGYSRSLDRKRIDKLISGAKTYLKHPTGQPLIEEWTSLRPMTYDDMPVIDRAEHLKNLIIATGHGMLGLTLAPGTGKMVCDMVLGRPVDININPYSLKRFK